MKAIKRVCASCGRKFEHVGGRKTASCGGCIGRKIAASWKKRNADRSAAGLPLRDMRRWPFPAEPHSYIAHRAVASAICHGVLPHPSTMSCVDCGCPASEYDHRDYNRIFDVQPVCRGCNVRRGGAIPFVLPAFALKASQPESKPAA